MRLESMIIAHFKTSKEKRKILKACNLACKIHANHTRDNGAPYISHPMRAALLLVQEFGVRDADIVAAAILHDVLEMSKMSHNSLGRLFGKRVAGIVKLLSKPKNRSSPGWEDRYYARIMAYPDARLVKFADRLDNLRDLKNAPRSKQARYLKATKKRFLPWMERDDRRFHSKLLVEIRKLEKSRMKKSR